MITGSSALYWGNLSKNVTEALISEMCNSVGVHLLHVKVFKNKATHESIGSAITLCASPMDAGKIFNSFNNSMLDGKAIRIMQYYDNFKELVNYKCCIVLYNLPTGITQKDLHDLCLPYGLVQSTFLEPVSNTGFVMFTNSGEKDLAITKLNNAILKEGSSPIKVFPYFGKEERILHRYTKGEYNNLYVKGLPKENFTEADLKAIFEKYGELHSVVLNKDEKNPKLNSGSAFVCFKENANAMKAKEELHNQEINGIKLHVDRHYKKHQMSELKEAKKKLSAEEFRVKYADCSIFIHPIPADLSRADLEKAFGKCGAIISSNIPLDKESGTQKSFGFICFSNKEDAQKAIKGFNGRSLWGKKLKVTLSKEKTASPKSYEKYGKYAVQPQIYGYAPLFTPPASMPEMPKTQEKTEESKPKTEDKKEIVEPSAAVAEQKEVENPYYLDKRFMKKCTPEQKKKYLTEKLSAIISEKEPEYSQKILTQISEISTDDLIPLFDELKLTEKISQIKSSLSESAPKPGTK